MGGRSRQKDEPARRLGGERSWRLGRLLLLRILLPEIWVLRFPLPDGRGILQGGEACPPSTPFSAPPPAVPFSRPVGPSPQAVPLGLQGVWEQGLGLPPTGQVATCPRMTSESLVRKDEENL